MPPGSMVSLRSRSWRSLMLSRLFLEVDGGEHVVDDALGRMGGLRTSAFIWSSGHSPATPLTDRRPRRPL